MQGAPSHITNGGIYGSLMSSRSNAAVGILGMHDPGASDGDCRKVEIRPMMYWRFL